MDKKPGDFFIGIVNFFAILLPGALLAFCSIDLVRDYHAIHPLVSEKTLAIINGEAQKWVAFIIASYLLGQFISLLGSFLDKVYGVVLNFFLRKTKGKSDSNSKFWNRKWHENELLYLAATGIKESHANINVGHLYVLSAEKLKTVNTFQWAKANTQLRFPEAVSEIHRLEADQKFFRGVVVILIIIFMLQLFKYELDLVEFVVLVTALLLSFWRYVDQRRKSTALAYIYLIAMERLPKDN